MPPLFETKGHRAAAEWRELPPSWVFDAFHACCSSWKSWLVTLDWNSVIRISHQWLPTPFRYHDLSMSTIHQWSQSTNVSPTKIPVTSKREEVHFQHLTKKRRHEKSSVTSGIFQSSTQTLQRIKTWANGIEMETFSHMLLESSLPSLTWAIHDSWRLVRVIISKSKINKKAIENETAGV